MLNTETPSLFLIIRRVPEGTGSAPSDLTDLITIYTGATLHNKISIAVKIKYVISTSFNYIKISLEVLHYNVLQTLNTIGRIY